MRNFSCFWKKKKASKSTSSKKTPLVVSCPLCKKGTVLKGKTAYGCSAYKDGCDFRYSFDTIREKAKEKPLTAELVIALLKESVGV